MPDSQHRLILLFVLTFGVVGIYLLSLARKNVQQPDSSSQDWLALVYSKNAVAVQYADAGLLFLTLCFLLTGLEMCSF